MREFHKRLICDGCEGMLLAVDDFQTACEDLIGSSTPVELFDHHASKAERTPVCPKCNGEMTVCRVRVKGKKLRREFTVCTHDGLWFGRDALADVFATLTRKLVGYVGGYKGEWGMASFQERTPSHDANDRLSITAWRNRPRKRSPTLTPVNAYRDQKLPCPACRTRELAFLADRYGCDECHGVFVENGALTGLVADMTSELWDLPAPTGAPGPRACPICAEALVVEALEGASIDRCANHGVWFDPAELEQVLQKLGSKPGGIVGWLRRLFLA